MPTLKPIVWKQTKRAYVTAPKWDGTWVLPAFQKDCMGDLTLVGFIGKRRMASISVIYYPPITGQKGEDLWAVRNKVVFSGRKWGRWSPIPPNLNALKLEVEEEITSRILELVDDSPTP